MATDNEIPDFPFFTVDGPTAVFGCQEDQYLDRREGSRVRCLLRDEAEAFSQLFYVGGKLEDHGFTFKPEYRSEGYSTLSALMRSFSPSHEAKEGTVALAIHHWCDRVPVEAAQVSA